MTLQISAQKLPKLCFTDFGGGSTVRLSEQRKDQARSVVRGELLALGVNNGIQLESMSTQMRTFIGNMNTIQQHQTWKSTTKRTIACAAMWGLLAHLPQLSYAAEIEYKPAIIVKQPQDQLVKLGQSATFTVTAAPESLKEPLSYQWVFKCNPVPSGTNKTLIINNVTTNDVGFYSCAVHRDTDFVMPEFVITQPALLMAWSSNSPLTVWSTPPPGGSGSGSVCPYPYVGYISYYVPCPPPADARCGFTLNSDTPKTAQDTRTDTKIKFFGKTFNNNGCGTSGFVSVSPLNSTSYKFCVYFPSNVPTNAYPLTLNGFNPPP